MYGDFEFNGIRAGDVNVMAAEIDNNGQNTDEVSGRDITFNTTKAAQSLNYKFHGSRHDTPLSFQFQIIKSVDCMTSKYFLPHEEVFYESWLCRHDGYRYLRFLEHGYENIYYNAQMNISWIRVSGRTIGATINVTCDSPYGYSPVQSYEYTNNSVKSFNIYSDSDDLGAIIPELIEIEILSSGNLSVSNSMEDLYSMTPDEQVMIINNCIKNEVITIDTGQNIIKTNNNSHNITNDFNWIYPRLINLDSIYPYSNLHENNTLGDNRQNTFTISGCNCNINFAYRTIRKATV